MLPISLRPNGRRALIVGGGNVAARKAQSLAEAGFPIAVVAERIGDRLRDLVQQCGGTFEERAYERGDLDGAALAVAATNDGDVNARVVADARAARVLVCDASAPERGDFTMAATLRVGDLTIAADSAGASPAFSQRVVRELADTFGPEYAGALRSLRRVRAAVHESFPREERAAILRELAERPVAELAAAPERTLVCASRRSALATIQSRTVAARLAERGIATTIFGVTTSGDRVQDRAIERLGSVNVFVTELENALRERHADYAVHSCKDLPSELAADMQLAAISTREDPRDAFCSERFDSLESLRPGSLVGTSSPRRRAQLAALRPDLRYETLRGNVDTRLRKLREGEYDAIVLAMAGLIRLRQGAQHVVPFDVEQIVPAVGQGALAVETAAGDDVAAILRDAVNDESAELCVECERAALRALHAGCSAPIGVHARIAGGEIVVDAAVATESGAMLRRRTTGRAATLREAQDLGAAFGSELSSHAAVAAGERT
ncbi:MAG TPA: hydroxymethylbilane synthase [Candidatus Cybelea sp.]|jgi:hydroxymethylbilane synthase|nr:hydroxymethylbilane synthase [Candidatus Cybelea sp.]